MLHRVVTLSLRNYVCIFQYHESLWGSQVQEDGRGLCPQFRDTVHHYQVHAMPNKL